MNFSRKLGSVFRPATKPSLLQFFVSKPQYQVRFASILGSLSDVKGAYNKRIRRGRGPSSGKGKTSGRGHKGQKQHGKVPAGFTGGQTSDEVVAGPRGFNNVFSVEMTPLNIDRIQSWIDQGRIDPTKPITFRELLKTRCVHGIKDGVKLLANNKERLKTPINICVSRASKAAIEQIESVGGTIVTRYFNKNGIYAITHPEKFDTPPKLANAYSRFDIEYYRDPKHRGYLSEQVTEGENPSLFFRSPFEKKAPAEKQKTNKKEKAANRLF